MIVFEQRIAVVHPPNSSRHSLSSGSTTSHNVFLTALWLRLTLYLVAFKDHTWLNGRAYIFFCLLNLIVYVQTLLAVPIALAQNTAIDQVEFIVNEAFWAHHTVNS